MQPHAAGRERRRRRVCLAGRPETHEYTRQFAAIWQISDNMTDAKIASPQASNRMPLWLKLAYTAFMAVLVPVYWHYYGPTNFALLITLVGIWIESPLLVSMCAVEILHRRRFGSRTFFPPSAGCP